MTTTSTQATNPARRRAQTAATDEGWRQVWVLVLAGGIVMGLALGVRHVQGLFLLPVTMDRGWSRETFGLAMAVQNITWGLAQPLTGMIADRFGPARVIACGLLCYAIGLFGMAHATSASTFLLSAGVLIGIGLAGTAFGAVYGALSQLVISERRGWALAVAGAIGGLGQFAMVPTAQLLLASFGWIDALLVLSVILALLLPLVLPMRQPGRSAVSTTPTASAITQAPRLDRDAMPMSAALREALGHRGFWLLNIGFLACGFQLAFIATHLPAYLLDKGMRSTDGVAALAIIALTNIFGIYGFGLLGTRYRRKRLLAGMYLARTAAMALFLLLPLSPITVYLFAGLMGLLWLGAVPLTNGLVSQVFGVRYINTLFGLVFFGHQLGSFLGVWLGGYVFEATHSYDLIWLAAIGLGVIAAALHWPIDDREIRTVPQGIPVAA